jgi:glycosyltransferase involved in cell wall biosynthesis
MRYIWDRFDDYFPPERPVLRLAASTLAPFLRSWDVRTAPRVDAFIANSQFVRERIRRYYARDAEVVYPFVDAQYLDAPFADEREGYHVIISALVPYKRVDLAIEAARASGKQLRVIGNGPLRESLADRAAGVAEFLGWVSTEEIIRQVGRAQSLILPGVEDFGITCLEAMACGTPVVALRDGGALESVSEGCGLFFDRPEAGLLAAALDRVESETWDRERLRARAREFAKERFLREYVDVVARCLRDRNVEC